MACAGVLEKVSPWMSVGNLQTQRCAGESTEQEAVAQGRKFAVNYVHRQHITSLHSWQRLCAPSLHGLCCHATCAKQYKHLTAVDMHQASAACKQMPALRLSVLHADNTPHHTAKIQARTWTTALTVTLTS